MYLLAKLLLNYEIGDDTVINKNSKPNSALELDLIMSKVSHPNSRAPAHHTVKTKRVALQALETTKASKQYIHITHV